MPRFKWKYVFRFLQDMLDERFMRNHLAKHVYRVMIVDDNENVPKEVIVPESTFRFAPFHYKVKKGERVPYGYTMIIDEDGYNVREAIYGVILDVIEKLPNPNWPDHPARIIRT